METGMLNTIYVRLFPVLKIEILDEEHHFSANHPEQHKVACP